MPQSTNLLDNLLYELAIITFLKLRGSETDREMERGRTRDVGMSVYRTGSATGAAGSRDLCVWPFTECVLNELVNYIDPLWLMSPATGRIKLQRSHTSQGEREAGERMSDAEEVSGDDKRVQVPDKMRAKRSKHQKGKASGPEGGK